MRYIKITIIYLSILFLIACNKKDSGRDYIGEWVNPKVENDRYNFERIIISPEGENFRVKWVKGVTNKMPWGGYGLGEKNEFDEIAIVENNLLKINQGMNFVTNISLLQNGNILMNGVEFVRASAVNINSSTNKQVSPDKENIDNEWSLFWENFCTAVHNKDKIALTELSAGNEFYDGGGGGLVNDFLNVGEVFKYLNESIEKGIRLESKTEKISNDNYLVFKYKNDKWLWYGVRGD